jgi:DNA-binding NarL/FixJ family response regulator
MSASHRILIVEDQEHTRNRLADAIRQHPDLDLVAEAETVAQGLGYLNSLQPDVLLTDLNLPDGNGIELIRSAAAGDTTESMVITVFGDEKHVVSALQAGATGYLLKDCDAVDVSKAILQMRGGGSPISPSIARHLLKHFHPPQANLPAEQPATPDSEKSGPALTRREHEVLRLIAKGFSYQEIAETLSLSVHTVTSHIKHIYRKLAVGSRGEAVYEASQIGLL